MKFSTAAKIESVIWDMKMADLPRSSNRSRINDLFNGFPPYSESEQTQNNHTTNVNFLESAKIAHDARRQFSNAILKPGNFFAVTTDFGPVHRRKEWSSVITKNLNRQMKRSLHYRETLRNVFAQVVLHGVGPAAWADASRPAPAQCSVGSLPGSASDHPVPAAWRRSDAAVRVRPVPLATIDRAVFPDPSRWS